MSKDIKRNQIISIVGATASGKTACALEIATTNITAGYYQKVHLLSADSRQVYQGLEILTGADVPSTWQRTREDRSTLDFFTSPDGTVALHGVSVIAANQDWSVAHFHQLYLTLVNQLHENEQLIVVGGTGFYQAQLQKNTETINVLPNKVLRQQLEKMAVEQLQERLQKIDSDHWQKMNNSDRHNPRRLVRAIEIANSRNSQAPDHHSTNELALVTIPIMYLRNDHEQRAAAIAARVEARFAAALKEIEQLFVKYQLNLAKLPVWPSLSSTGLSELVAYLNGEIDQKSCQAKWINSEISYAKHQELYLSKYLSKYVKTN